MLSVKESKTFLDYIVHQATPADHTTDYEFEVALDNKAFMEQRIRTSFVLALVEKCFQIRL